MLSDHISLLESAYEKADIDILFYGKENNSKTNHKFLIYHHFKIWYVTWYATH